MLQRGVNPFCPSYWISRRASAPEMFRASLKMPTLCVQYEFLGSPVKQHPLKTCAFEVAGGVTGVRRAYDQRIAVTTRRISSPGSPPEA